MHERLCKELTDQGIDIVGCHIGMYDECREWARENIDKYFEVYLKVDIDDLIRWDSKGLYQKAINKEIQNVLGIDLPVEEPKNPDILIVNNREKTPEQICDEIIKKAREKFKSIY